MNIEKLITIGAMLVFLAASTGQLPQAIRAIQIAKMHLLKESQGSLWPKAMVLPYRHDN